MAKKDDKDPGKERQDRADAVRSAAAQAVAAAAGQAQLTRDRAQELADELAGVAGRVREALEDLRPPSGDDVRELGKRLDALERRVAALERPPRARKKPPKS